MPYSGRDRPLLNFKNGKRIKLVKAIRLKTHIDIFDEKSFSIFLSGMGGVENSFFYLMMWSCLKNMCDIQINL